VISRVIVAICSVMASVGLLVVGMGRAYVNHNNGMIHLGVVLMIVGAVGTLLGALWYRAEERAAEAELRAEAARRGN
jgi:CheY-specific phosphatase CheX